MQFGCQRVHASRTVGPIKAGIATDRPPLFLKTLCLDYILGCVGFLGSNEGPQNKIRIYVCIFYKEINCLQR